MNGYKHNEVLVKNIFEDIRKATKDFRFFTPKIIRSKPQILLLFRLHLDLDQDKFANLIEKVKSTVSYYENGESSPTMNSAKKIFAKIFPLVKFPLDLDKILTSFNSQSLKAKGFSDKKRAVELAKRSNVNWKRKQVNGAKLNGLQTRTRQEIVIESSLRRLEADVVPQATLLVGESRAGAIITDFLINNNIVVEATQDHLDYKFSKICLKKAKILAYRGFRIKKYFP